MVDIALPIYNGDLISSLFGSMIFPKDCHRAEIFAGHFLSQAVTNCADDNLLELLRPIEIRSLLSASNRYVSIADAAKKAAYAGMQAGMMAAYMWHAHALGQSASWNDAAIASEKLCGTGTAGARSSLMKAKSDFASVIHYWAILSIQYANRYPRDPALFISQAEALLHRMRKLEAAGMIGGSSFTSSKIYVPILAFDWRRDGSIRAGKLPNGLITSPKPVGGRPRKYQS